MRPHAALLLRVSASKLPLSGAVDAYRSPLAELAAAVVELWHAFGSAFPAERQGVANWIHMYRRHAAPTMAERIGESR